eukprot:3994502-Prymnesium_polylepis.1
MSKRRCTAMAFGGCVQAAAAQRDGSWALPLKKASIAEGLVTQLEFDWMRGHLGGGARSFTLIPLDALRA